MNPEKGRKTEKQGCGPSHLIHIISYYLVLLGSACRGLGRRGAPDRRGCRRHSGATGTRRAALPSARQTRPWLTLWGTSEHQMQEFQT